MKKLCLIYNYAAHYRAAIFELIDKTFDCDFVFGDNYLDVKKMDYSLLRGHVTEVHNARASSFYVQRGVMRFLKHPYDCYLLLGEIRCLSTWCFLLRSRLQKDKKVYLWSHGWYGKENGIKKILGRWFYGMADGTFLYNYYARGLMIEGGMDPDKLFVIHNSLDYDSQIRIRAGLASQDLYRQHFGNLDEVLLFVGRLTPVKKLDMLLEATALASRSGDHYNVVLIGDGQMLAELREKAAALGLQDRVWFYGACYDEKDLGNLIYNADLCVAPGNVGLTAMHSLVFGTPVITHNCFKWQMPEFEAIIPGVTGSFYEYGNVESLKDTIRLWFEAHNADREEVRQACYSEIDRSWTPAFQIEVLKSHLQ